MSYNYTTYSNALRTYLIVPLNKTDNDFELILPRIIEAAELRCYRECDFLYTRTVSSANATTASSRDATLPSNIIICENINLITPAGTTDPESGTRVPLERVSLDFLNLTWPAASSTGTPTRYALLDNDSIRLAPTPNGVFTLEVFGIYRPTALSPSTTTTYLTDNIPDLFMAASVKAGADYLQDLELSALWDSAYKTAFASVNVEDLRQKAASVSWQPFSPTPMANVARDRSRG